MMAPGRLRGASAALALLMTLALTGCGDDEVDESSGAGEATASTEDSTADADEQTDTDAEEAADIDPADAPAGVDCLYGNWYLDNDSFKDVLTQAGGNVVSMSGWAIVTYNPDGTTMSTYDKWTTVATQEGGTATMVRDGEDRGTFVVSGDQIAVTETDAGSVLTMTVETGGQDPITMTSPHEEFSVSNGAFTCEGDTHTVTTDGATVVLKREH